jgi:3-oxoacyl-[acyl-carrier protein] reductase
MFQRIVEKYRDAHCVVIGAGGIGTAIATSLAHAGAKLAIADASRASVDKLAGVLGSNLAAKHQLDVRTHETVRTFFSEIEQSVGAVDFLFYTAGVLNIEPFLETSSETWDQAIAINLSGAFHCVRAVTDSMVQRKRGSILLLGSIAGTKARSGTRVNPVYNTTKAGLAAFVNATAMQLRPHRVRINCISPGPTATPMMALQPEAVNRAVDEIALDGRMNQPDDIAEVALFVAGQGRFTGEDVAVGGGLGLGG